MLATSLLFAPNTARAEVIEVDSLADSGTGSLRAAVDKANITPGLDTITFEPGLTGTITLTTGEISITDDLIVDGSGAPSLIVSGNDASRIFAVETLAALTIEKMQLSAGDGLDEGGGAIISFGDVVIRSSVISSGSTGGSGGAVLSEGRVTVVASEIKDNFARRGGAIYASEVVIEGGSSLVDNVGFADGGGVFALSVFEMRDSFITGNSSCMSDGTMYGGGGVLSFADNVTISNSSFVGNSCPTRQGGGLRIHQSDAVVDIDDSTFEDNSADTGGGLYMRQSTLTIDGSTFDGNVADRGGAMMTVSGTAEVENSTFDSNVAGDGGAIYASGTTLMLTSSTLSTNSGRDGGGAINSETADVTTINTDFFANTADSASGRGGGAVYAQGGLLNVVGGEFSDNSATRGGAISVDINTDISIVDATFVRNAATDGNGGAIDVEQGLGQGDVLLGGLLFDQNTSTNEGGAVSVAADSIVTITDVTATRNSAGVFGGAVALNAPAGTEVKFTIDGSTFDDNTSPRGGALFVDDGNGSVTESSFDANSADGNAGGAIRLKGTSFALTDSNVTSNTATFGGGGLFSEEASVVEIINSTFSDNNARSGGAIRAFEGQLTVVGGEFSDNSAEEGGAISVSLSDDLSITNAAFLGNEASVGDGGAIGVQFGDIGSGSVLVDNSMFDRNSAAEDGGAVRLRGAEIGAFRSITATNNAAGGQGGAISVESSSMTLSNSSLLDNTAGGSGGAVSGEAVFVYSSTLARNQSGLDGGAVFARDSVVVSDSTLSVNSASGSGGAFAGIGSSDSLNHVTVTGNRAGVSGGGIHNDTGPFGAVVSSIVYGNEAPESPDIAVGRAPRYSIVGDMGSTPATEPDGSPAQGLLLGADPLLGPLADNGGGTLTHRLGARSQAIDGGRLVPEKPSVDQRGATREPGSVEDLGAIEYDGVLPVWIPVTPARLADTRSSGETIDGRFRAGGVIPAGQFVEIDVAGRGGVPESATGAVVNITAINPSVDGFLTVYPCTDELPNASSVNYTQGVNLANEVVAGLSDVGSICVYSKEDTHIAVDVVGSVSSGSPFVPVEPARLLDTRDLGVTIDSRFRAGGRQAAGTEITLDVGGRHGIPVDAAAVVVNVVAVRPSATGFLTVHGCVADRPLSSSLNYVTGGNRANEILAGLDADGRLCIYTDAATDLLVDVVGFLPAGTDLTPVEPARVYETRANTSTVDGKFSGGGKAEAGATTRIQIAGRAGVSTDATSVNINVTAVAATAAGFATVFPCGDRPLASSLNYTPGVNGGNDLVAELDAGGGLCVYNLSETHLTIDVTGYTTL